MEKYERAKRVFIFFMKVLKYMNMNPNLCRKSLLILYNGICYQSSLSLFSKDNKREPHTSNFAHNVVSDIFDVISYISFTSMAVV